MQKLSLSAKLCLNAILLCKISLRNITIFGKYSINAYLCTRNQVSLVSKAERWYISELMRNNRYINSVSQQYGEVELCNTPRTSYTELVTLSKHKGKEASNTHHARWKNASRVRLEKYRNTLTHER